MNEHYYTENPTSEIKKKSFSFTIKGVTLSFDSVSGVFAFGERIDKASQLLIESFQPTGHSILDIGCGYGAIGLFFKAIFPSQSVWMSDINTRAVDFAIKNAQQNRLDVNISVSNLFSAYPDQTFDDIVSNPPISAGKKLNTQLINEAWDHLNPGGALWLVAFHNKGGSTLKDLMAARYGNVEDIVKSGGIRVYKSIRK